MVDLVISIFKTSSLRTNPQAHKVRTNLAFMVRILVVTTNLSIIGQHVKSVENLDTMPLTAIIGWILLTKAKIHLLSLLPWQVPPMLLSLTIRTFGLLIQVPLITSQLILTTFHCNLSTKDLNKSLWEVVSLYQSIT